jgi:CBS domain-containing protein
MPVVNDDGAVVGVIAGSDVIALETGSVPPAPQGRRRFFRKGRVERPAKLHGRIASDVMTMPAITMEPYRSVGAAAQTMLERKIHRIPIVSHGNLIGIITASDLVRAFARTDEEIAKEVRDKMRYWLDLASDSGHVEVAIDSQVISLHGTVARRSTAFELAEAAAAVPGVIDVHSDVDWIEDDSKPARDFGLRVYW